MKKLILTKQPKAPEFLPPNDPSLPPGPPQMNKPVGSPPPPVEPPNSFETCMDTARRAAGGQVEKAHLWAALAQAHATKQLADKLDALNEYLGVYDDAADDEHEAGDAPDPRLSDAIAEGILGAVSIVKDDLLATDLVQAAIAAAERGAASEKVAASEEKEEEEPSEN